MRLNPSNPGAFAGLLALLGLPGTAASQGDVLPTQRISGPDESVEAEEGAQFLLLPVGARTVGMGGAISGLTGNPESVLWAPAGLVGLEEGRLLFNHHEGVFDTRSEVLSFIWPTRAIGTFALTYYLVDFGELASTGSDGTVIGTLNVRNQAFLLSYAGRVVGSLGAGVSYKLIQLITRCDGLCTDVQAETQTTHAVDLGLVLDGFAGIPISLGGSVRNLGFDLKGENDRDRLPARVRVGLAYQALSAFTTDTTFALALAIDVEDKVRALGDPDLMVGTEFGVAQMFYLRAGYAFLRARPDVPTLGLGLRHNWFYLNMSRGFDEVSSAIGEESIQVSFGVIF